jgi:hypothetical protein
MLAPSFGVEKAGWFRGEEGSRPRVFSAAPVHHSANEPSLCRQIGFRQLCGSLVRSMT